MAHGLCQLMKTHGPLRDAHIIPRAFMRRVGPEPFMESDGLSRSKKRFTGWYDPNILGAEGESLLATYDDAAAKAFVARGLTYRTRRSHFDPNVLLDDIVPNTIFMLEDVDTRALRLFALSLLWRAAVSDLEVFRSIVVSPSHLNDIGARLREGDPGSYRDYPVRFGVFDGVEELTKMAPIMMREPPAVRFFLDGVTCYICPRRRWKQVDECGGLIAGYEPNRMAMFCYSSVASWHHEMDEHTLQQVRRLEGDVFAGFGRSSRRSR